MILLRNVAGAALTSWWAYSHVQRVRLRPKFEAMQVISELRNPDGDLSRVIPNTTSTWAKSYTFPPPTQPRRRQRPWWWFWRQRRSRNNSNDDDDDLEWHYWLGSKNAPPKDSFCRFTSEMCCVLDTNEKPAKLVSIWGKGRKTPNNSIQELIRQKRRNNNKISNKPTITEDLATFVTIQKRCEKAKPIIITSDYDASSLDGSYTYCYRDYVSNEEFSSILCQRGCIDNLLVRFRKSSQLDIINADDDEGGITSTTSSSTKKNDELKCRLRDHIALGGFVPATIQWDGHLNSESETNNQIEIEWDSVRIRLGWNSKLLGHTFRKLDKIYDARSQPWLLKVPAYTKNNDNDNDSTADNSNNILICYREGHGNLIFAR